MGVQDANIVDGPEGKVAHRPIPFALDSVGSGETDTVVITHTPGYRFEIVGFEVFAQAVTATASLTVKRGSDVALSASVTPVAGSEVKGTVKASGEQYGDSDDAVSVEVTTDGTGALTGLQGRVLIRKRAGFMDALG